MFRLFKKTAVTRPTEVATETIDVVKSVELIRQLGQTVVDSIDDGALEHQYRHAQAVGQDGTNTIGYFYPSFKEKLFDAGFVWIVRADFVRRFRYCADLQIGRAAVSEDLRFRYADRVSYIGDIPDAALRRLSKADRLLNYFTVHSCQPLKVERGRLVDPVLVGWYDDPVIQVDGSGRLVRCSDFCLGVVVAVWDGEKELEAI